MSKINEGGILLKNNSYLKAKNNLGNEANLLKLNAGNNPEFANPVVAPDGTVAGHLATKGQMDTAIADAVGDYIPLTQKGAANGVCPLESDSKISSTYLPSYVDDVLEFANLAAFPGTGETGKIYIAIDTNKQYRWSGSVYVEITSGAVSSVFGRTGVVTAQSGDYTTDEVTEGTNQYFTQARARAAAVADIITDGVTNVAPSQNAVFDALANKANASHTHTASEITDFTAAAKAAAVADAISNGVTDVAPSQNAVFDALALKQDAATDAAAARAAQRFGEEDLTLNGTDISNGYKDLAQEALAGSLQVFAFGGVKQRLTSDYTLSVVSTKTRITFAGDLLGLVSGDILSVNYQY